MSISKDDENFIPKRMAVAIAILIMFLLHYTTLFLSSCFNFKYKGEYTSRRVFLYGISGLLSLSTIQSSVFSTVLAWLTLVPLSILHFSNYPKFKTLYQLQDSLWLTYYTLQITWYLGIIIDFYS
ncbi:unnamed protein product (macronuclear) [Paramecium tetraurelia]|uniref:Uncharacterized protein n=1 Tax=Paramecium tetraurelia TaxID=5888 RepID=A0C8M9_PARTE|nr:uncharacterized protein GSPATT00036281001 [Paramecium tetraurelia]CAK67146.1 unnamed protein product [Paramecium tetraurelia]|eukprot:XP_001434543.1 hypothetical protein (macronuclear) [Paramecium tetraurelia strain d4-2]